MSFGYNLTPLNSFGFANGYAYPGLTAASYGYGLGTSYLSPYGFYPPPPPPLTPTADFITVTPSPAPPQSPAAEYKSQVEQNILNSTEPIQTNETSTVNANGTQGIYLNKFEADKWLGDFPITEYKLNEDFFPRFIYKQSKPVHLIKSHSIKYLKPPAAPAPGDIVIKQEANIPTAPAPPVIIRQVPLKCCSPEPLVIREKPPCPPAQVCKKEIIIPGKKLPAPARKLVVERLAPIPVKPQPVLVERWLPYQKQERRVIFKQAPPDPIPEKPKNLIIQWHPPCVCVKEQYKNLGIEPANPAEYVAKYGSQLRNKCELPKFALDMKPTDGTNPDSCSDQDPTLVGDLHALKLIDLDKEGLGAYKNLVICSESKDKIQSPTISNKSSSSSSKSTPAAFSPLSSVASGDCNKQK